GDVDVERSGASAQSLRRLDVTHLRVFVGDENNGVADFQFSVHDLAVWAGHARKFLSAKRFFVKLNCFGRVPYNKAGGYGMEAFRNWFCGSCHEFFSFLFFWLDRGCPQSTCLQPSIS